MTFIYQLEDILNPNKMENLTAVQRMIKTLKGYYGEDNLQAINFNFYLELEKKQLIEAYDDALGSCESLDGLEYYTNKYNK